ncbi:threonine synthase [Gardnerella greenwoodii]|uniref:Threonine synthase n=1 Tax=Gardnerella greenwoodii TaxID=2914925 RepID=A0A2N6RXB0_9BIFI|nr:threonine synthase [Gardnerella greenwoodii]MDF0753693.1 threonine synthase [Gardnerella greenwoodii]PMC42756.1 threonine synthase [Gardnerella greenwoodii]
MAEDTAIFHSTRATTPTCTAKQAIRKGIAEDGGLFVADTLGSTRYDISKLQGKSYQEIAQDILQILLPDYSQEELSDCVKLAYADQWSNSDITPIRQLGNTSDFVMELFHGPTCAFKDVALQMLPQLMSRSQNKTEKSESNNNKNVMILTATSGDTGKAALAGFADVPGTSMVTFYPEGKVSRVQELQMTTQAGKNVRVCAVRGNFDDAQTGVKQIFTNSELNKNIEEDANIELSSANSINVGRLVPQVVYYFAAYKQLVERKTIALGDEVEFCVPTGNFGDILAGYYAKMLGLPVKHLIVASNSNNVLFDFLVSGTYNRQRPFHHTVAPSMDILVSSNLERMLYYMCNKDTRLIQMLMNDLAQWGAFEIPENVLAKIRAIFGCGWANEDQIREAISDCWNKYKYVIDPHTACGYFVMQHIPHDESVPRVLLSTASPYKFPRVVAEALGLKNVQNMDDFQCMDALSEATGTKAPSMLRELENKTPRFTDVIDISQMPSYVQTQANNFAK